MTDQLALNLTPADHGRIAKQLAAVRDAMSDGRWHTLFALSRITGASEASCSARLRDLRKPRYGSRTVERRTVMGGGGIFEYRLVP